MPTYEFRCPEGHDFEKFYRSIGSAPAEVMCPACGKTAERILSAGGGLVFKGSGFYITDYGKDGKKAQTRTPAPAEGATPATGGDTPAKVETAGDAAMGSREAKPAPEPKTAVPAPVSPTKPSRKAKDSE